MPNLSAERLRDWGLLLACNLIWSSQFVLVKIVQEQMGPVAATFFPMTLATLMLIPILWREGKLNSKSRTLSVQPNSRTSAKADKALPVHFSSDCP